MVSYQDAVNAAARAWDGVDLTDICLHEHCALNHTADQLMRREYLRGQVELISELGLDSSAAWMDDDMRVLRIARAIQRAVDGKQP
jgi:hypothetical protein